MLTVNESDLEKLQEPARSEVGRLCGAISCIIGGRNAEAVIKLQAFMANWRIDHPDLPIIPRPDRRDVPDSRPPTDKQMSYALKVSMYTGVKLPASVTRSEFSKFLEANVPVFNSIMASAREQGENPEPRISEEEAVSNSRVKPASAQAYGTGSCVKCQDRQERYDEQHGIDRKPADDEEYPF